jgi:uncharacterized protein YegL
MKTDDINFDLDFANFNPDEIQVDETINAVFCVDTSSSVGSYVKELNYAFNEFTEAMKKSHIADKLMVSVIEFNSKVNIQCGFKPISTFQKVDFSKKIGGMTALYDGVLLGIKNALAYRQNLENSGINTKTIIYVITDGADNVSVNSANMIAKEIADQKKDERGAFSFSSILFGVGNQADFQAAQQEMGIEHLAKIGTSGAEMKKMIGFISQSISSMSAGNPNIPLF